MMNIDFLTASRYLKIYDWVNKKYPNVNFSESLFPNQISSKLWLVKELSRMDIKSKQKIEIVGSWFGWPLVDLLSKSIPIEKITLYDIDPIACEISGMYKRIFNNDRVKIINKNYWSVMEDSDATILINCSSEHMKESFYMFSDRYINFPLLAIQSNNMTNISDHINCCFDEDEVVEKHKINKVFYKGSLKVNDLSTDGRKRFMVIGKF